VRGRAVNRCPYCAKLAAWENLEMLALDALQGEGPSVLLVLGTRTPTIEMHRFNRGLERVLAALRRRWPEARYACQVEFTTGYSRYSGGLRRPHWNLLLKGIPGEAAPLVHEVAARVWCQNVDAEPEAQHAQPIEAVGGLLRYLALHFQKASQAPPEGFTGQRFNCSRNYFNGCTRAVARARARELVAMKREVWRARQVHDDPHDVELAAQLAYRRTMNTQWVLATDRGARIAPSAPAPRTPRERVSRRVRERHDARMAPAWLPERQVLFSLAGDLL
jgi:hypothetical protein